MSLFKYIYSRLFGLNIIQEPIVNQETKLSLLLIFVLLYSCREYDGLIFTLILFKNCSFPYTTFVVELIP